MGVALFMLLIQSLFHSSLDSFKLCCVIRWSSTESPGVMWLPETLGHRYRNILICGCYVRVNLSKRETKGEWSRILWEICITVRPNHGSNRLKQKLLLMESDNFLSPCNMWCLEVYVLNSVFVSTLSLDSSKLCCSIIRMNQFQPLLLTKQTTLLNLIL